MIYFTLLLVATLAMEPPLLQTDHLAGGYPEWHQRPLIQPVPLRTADRFASDQLPIQNWHRKKQCNTNIAIFDWDDTLIPNTWINVEYGGDHFEACDDRFYKDAKTRERMAYLLKPFDKAQAENLERIAKHMKVYIVSNAKQSWLDFRHEWFPLMSKVIRDYSIEVISARLSERSSRCDKMARYREILCRRENIHADNVYAIGDRKWDLDALTNLETDVACLAERYTVKLPQIPASLTPDDPSFDNDGPLSLFRRRQSAKNMMDCNLKQIEVVSKLLTGTEPGNAFLGNPDGWRQHMELTSEARRSGTNVEVLVTPIFSGGVPRVPSLSTEGDDDEVDPLFNDAAADAYRTGMQRQMDQIAAMRRG